MFVAWGIIAVVDTIWFPVAGLIDTAWIVTRPNPETDSTAHRLRNGFTCLQALCKRTRAAGVAVTTASHC